MGYKKNVWQSMVLVMQLGINMIVPILMCTALGVYLGNRWNMKILVVPLFIMGALAGFRNCYMMAKKIYENKDNSRDKGNVKKNK